MSIKHLSPRIKEDLIKQVRQDYNLKKSLLNLCEKDEEILNSVIDLLNVKSDPHLSDDEMKNRKVESLNTFYKAMKNSFNHVNINIRISK